MPANIRFEGEKIDLSKLKPYQMPESIQLNTARILGYVVDGNHCFAIYVPRVFDRNNFNPLRNFFSYVISEDGKVRIEGVSEKVGEKVRPYYTKPTEEQVRFADNLRNQEVSEAARAGYKSSFNREYDDVIDTYNAIIAESKDKNSPYFSISVEDAYLKAIGKKRARKAA